MLRSGHWEEAVAGRGSTRGGSQAEVGPGPRSQWVSWVGGVYMNKGRGLN